MSIQKQYGLIGYPLGHSFSQRFFSDKFKQEGTDAIYSNYEISDIRDILNILKDNSNLIGLNVTIPYKESILTFLSELSEEAKEIGAVNVVKVLRNGTDFILKGYNSDVVGFVNSIEPLLNESVHKKALVLGTGGASKAVVYGLNKLGIEAQLVSRSRREGMIVYEELTKEVVEEYRVVVNCTPLGTYPNVEGMADIPYQYLTPEHLLYDLVYNPVKTKFLQKGEEKGAQIKNGAEMLKLQALEAWRIWNE